MLDAFERVKHERSIPAHVFVLQRDIYAESPCAPRAILFPIRLLEGEQTSQPGTMAEQAKEPGLFLW
jgi:hypothetical protein